MAPRALLLTFVSACLLTLCLCCFVAGCSSARVRANGPYESVAPTTRVPYLDPSVRRLGYIDSTGTVAVPPSYLQARDFRDGLAVVALGSPPGRVVVVDQTGQTVIDDPELQDFGAWRNASEGAIAYSDEGRLAAYDTYGKLLFKRCVRQLMLKTDFHEGCAVVVRTSEAAIRAYGYVDLTGREFIDPVYAFAMPFESGLALVCVRWELDEDADLTAPGQGLWQYLDRDGKVLRQWDDSSGMPFAGPWVGADEWGGPPTRGRRLFRFKSADNGRFGYMDGSGTTIIPAAFLSATDFLDGMAKVWLPGQTLGEPHDERRNPVDEAGEHSRGPLIITESGCVVFDHRRSLEVVAPQGGVVWYRDAEERWCGHDCKGRVLFRTRKFSWYAESRFAHGLAPVRSGNGKHGFIDRAGRMRIAPRYDYAWPFDSGLALANRGGTFSGRPGVTPFRDGIVGGTWFYLNVRGSEVCKWSEP